MLDISNSLKTLEDLESAVLQLEAIVKDGVGMADLPALWNLLPTLSSLYKDARASVAELLDLDAVEGGKLSARLILLVDRVFHVFK